MTLLFEQVARLPIPNDNVAIATRQLPAGTEIVFGSETIRLTCDLLVGHRFAVRDIAESAPLLSWGQTFGLATRPIRAGDYVVNVDVLKELKSRSLGIILPSEPNFENDLERFTFDRSTFTPAESLPRHETIRTFQGYQRAGGRGVGTRNTVILLGTNSLVSGFLNRLEQRLQHILEQYPNIDGIVAVAHTEGGYAKPNNQTLLLRTLAGFIVNPNVGAALIVDSGNTAINNALLYDYMKQENYPLAHVLHDFMSLSTSFEDDLKRAESLVKEWLNAVNAMERTPQPISTLKIALQCGGSDAFSGISGNPLAACVAKEVIQFGGCANLAETDELIGAETYVLDKVRDADTAEKFLSFIARFKERVGWHGHSADGNPSGGNKFRGLYNIYLKSLGAATKRHADVRLDYVIDYGEPMRESGYYFMDSPGNDLESIAGQIASGCNIIFFVTGNGSITNFPFVPTIKIVTTTERYNLLAADMDINAGAYLDGVPLEQLTQETLQYALDVASGQRSVGEQAGHSQVQIWRDWPITHPVELEPLQNRVFDGKPIAINADVQIPPIDNLRLLRVGDHVTSDSVGLILPTSLCSGQIARLCVEALNTHSMLAESGLSRFVTLTHTEGCGGSVNPEFRDTLLGYLSHPFVRQALLLEHGCEATHNDYFRNAMLKRGLHPDDYGWASIQLDGGIQPVVQKMIHWFEAQLRNTVNPEPVSADLSHVQMAFVTQGGLPDDALLDSYITLTKMIVGAGGTVVLHEQDDLLKTNFMTRLTENGRSEPSLGYAQTPREAGLYIMAMPTRNWGEILTGLGAAGVALILAHIYDQPVHGHPLIPVLQVSPQRSRDIDLHLQGNATQQLLNGIVETLSRRYIPKVVATGNVYFQVTRGLLGVSL